MADPSFPVAPIRHESITTMLILKRALISLIFALFDMQNMPRPFKKMKDLDMDEVIADIVKKLNE